MRRAVLVLLASLAPAALCAVAAPATTEAQARPAKLIGMLQDPDTGGFVLLFEMPPPQ